MLLNSKSSSGVYKVRWEKCHWIWWLHKSTSSENNNLHVFMLFNTHILPTFFLKKGSFSTCVYLNFCHKRIWWFSKIFREVLLKLKSKHYKHVEEDALVRWDQHWNLEQNARFCRKLTLHIRLNRTSGSGSIMVWIWWLDQGHDYTEV